MILVSLAEDFWTHTSPAKKQVTPSMPMNFFFFKVQENFNWFCNCKHFIESNASLHKSQKSYIGTSKAILSIVASQIHLFIMMTLCKPNKPFSFAAYKMPNSQPWVLFSDFFPRTMENWWGQQQVTYFLSIHKTWF